MDFFYDGDDTRRKTRHTHGGLLFILSVLAPTRVPTGLASRTSRHAERTYTYYESSPGFVRVPRGALPRSHQRGCRVAEGVSTSFFATGFSAILEGTDAINGSGAWHRTARNYFREHRPRGLGASISRVQSRVPRV